jgi:hypothetical protein
MKLGTTKLIMGQMLKHYDKFGVIGLLLSHLKDNGRTMGRVGDGGRIPRMMGDDKYQWKNIKKILKAC